MRYCPAGHWLGPNRVLVGYQHCYCPRGGHTTRFCRTKGCGLETHEPPLTDACRIKSGPDER